MAGKGIIPCALVFAGLLGFANTTSAQADEICAEVGAMPGLDSPFAHVPYVYGRVILKGFDPAARPPKVSVVLSDSQQIANRYMVGKTGSYCFKRSGGGGTIIVEMDGLEVARRSLPGFGATQQREDFEIYPTGAQRPVPPGAVSARFYHPPNHKTLDLYKKAAEAENTKDPRKTVELLKEIVAIDPADFIAWAKLGFLYFEQNSLDDAEAAFRKSLGLKVEYTPAWVNVGKIRIAQKQFAAAIEIFKHAASLDPTSARTYQLLGEAYLLARQGTLGAEALNQAIKLDPVGMAECHLQLAHLYQLAGATQLAAKEYEMFLAKVPNHPDRKKFEKYIKNNP